jgi:hypothetical protein
MRNLFIAAWIIATSHAVAQSGPAQAGLEFVGNSSIQEITAALQSGSLEFQPVEEAQIIPAEYVGRSYSPFSALRPSNGPSGQWHDQYGNRLQLDCGVFSCDVYRENRPAPPPPVYDGGGSYPSYQGGSSSGGSSGSSHGGGRIL